MVCFPCKTNAIGLLCSLCPKIVASPLVTSTKVLEKPEFKFKIAHPALASACAVGKMQWPHLMPSSRPASPLSEPSASASLKYGFVQTANSLDLAGSFDEAK